MIIIGFLLSLVGGALIETPIVGLIHGENGIGAVIFGGLCGLLFLGPGLVMFIYGAKEIYEKRKNIRIKDLLEVLKPGFKEANGENYLDWILLDFRKHYSEFLSKPHIDENDPIQGEVTQIFRNILQFQKNRLQRLGLTCETIVRRMKYTREDGIYTEHYQDGKYDITGVKEEVAAQTIYKKGDKEIFKKIDRDTANYTIIKAKRVGSSKIICPNCGVETTREALLDGCDYCGTRFTVEDLGNRIAVFAFRPDYALREEKYKRTRNKTVAAIVILAVLVVVAGFSAFGIISFPDFLKEANGGIILTVGGTIFALIIAVPFYILSFVIVYLGYFVAGGIIFFFVNRRIRKWLKSRATGPMMDRMWENTIREKDPNFSLANFYSGVQNKLSALIFADDKKQIQAFADAGADLTRLFGAYSDVVGVDVDRFQVLDYRTDNALQHAEVEAGLILTRYKGRKCVVRNEKMRLRLAKALDCKTQVVCAPAVMTCKGCGSSLDLLQGKECPYCGRELELIHYDWVIRDVRASKRFSL